MANQKQFRIPQCVFFDLDGTLLDSLPGIERSIREAFAACNLEMHDIEVRSLIGPPVRKMLEQLARRPPTESELDRLERYFRLSYDATAWQVTRCYPGAGEALQAMRARGIRLFVISNKPRHIAMRVLEAEGMAALFEEMMTRDSRQPPYPSKEEMMAALLASHGLQSEECIMVGDTMEDALAAVQTNMSFVLMTHGYGDVPEAAGIPVLCRMKSFSEFMPMLAKETSAL